MMKINQLEDYTLISFGPKFIYSMPETIIDQVMKTKRPFKYMLNVVRYTTVVCVRLH